MAIPSDVLSPARSPTPAVPRNDARNRHEAARRWRTTTSRSDAVDPVRDHRAAIKLGDLRARSQLERARPGCPSWPTTLLLAYASHRHPPRPADARRSAPRSRRPSTRWLQWRPQGGGAAWLDPPFRAGTRRPPGKDQRVARPELGPRCERDLIDQLGVGRDSAALWCRRVRTAGPHRTAHR